MHVVELNKGTAFTFMTYTYNEMLTGNTFNWIYRGCVFDNHFTVFNQHGMKLILAPAPDLTISNELKSESEACCLEVCS